MIINMTYDFSTDKFTLVIGVSEDGIAYIDRCSLKGGENRKKKNPRFAALAEVHIAGTNQDDHHGGKHTGTYASWAAKYISHTDTENELGRKIEILLSDGKMNITVHYQLYRDIAAMRTWTVVSNISDEIIGLEYVSSFAMTGIDVGEEDIEKKLRIHIPYNSWCREVNWRDFTPAALGLRANNVFSMNRISLSNTGTWSAKEYLPMGAVCNSETGEAMMWQIEHNGSWHWEISDISSMLYLRLSGPTEQENGWYKELTPGESFDSVKACLTFAEDFDGALCEMTKYRRTIAKRSAADSKLPVIFNDYMNCLRANPTEEKVLPVIDIAADLGAEYYVMDAGWYSDGPWWDLVGEWEPCERRFPNGIKKVFDYVKEKGMIPGIWLEPEAMGIKCPLADKMPDECFFIRHGKRVIDHGRYLLDFRHPEVRRHIMGVIDRVVGEYGVGYIKADYNIDGGLGTEVDADSFGDGLLSHNRAYMDFLDEVTAKYPDLILENCASGGMRMEYMSLAHSHIQSTSDQENYLENAYISAASVTAVIPEQSAVWSYPVAGCGRDAVAVNMINAILQRIHMSGEVWALREDERALVKEGIKLYKTLRRDTSAALPFFPIGLPRHGDTHFANGQRCGEAFRMAVYSYEPAPYTLHIPMENINEVKVLYPSSTDCTVTKTADGIDVIFPRANMAVLIEAK